MMCTTPHRNTIQVESNEHVCGYELFRIPIHFVIIQEKLLDGCDYDFSFHAVFGAFPWLQVSQGQVNSYNFNGHFAGFPPPFSSHTFPVRSSVMCYLK